LVSTLDTQVALQNSTKIGAGWCLRLVFLAGQL